MQFSKPLIYSLGCILLVGVAFPIFGSWLWMNPERGIGNVAWTLWTDHLWCPLMLFVPFGVQAIWTVRTVQRNRYSAYGTWFLTFAGLCGIIVVLAPGLRAAWLVSQAPTPIMWVFISFVATCTMAIAMGTAYLTITYLWIFK